MVLCETLYDREMQKFKRELLLRILKENRGNQSRAAEVLGVHRNTLLRSLKELGIPGPVLRKMIRTELAARRRT
jgi:DNA-binding protein Fis